jgi:hypothetical protein
MEFGFRKINVDDSRREIKEQLEALMSNYRRGLSLCQFHAQRIIRKVFGAVFFAIKHKLVYPDGLVTVLIIARIMTCELSVPLYRFGSRKCTMDRNDLAGSTLRINLSPRRCMTRK